MSEVLPFDFTVDKATNTIHVKRAFAAELELVWDAFTKPEILDQWGAPEPWTCQTHSMDFTVGGRRLYSMFNPDGQEHWSVQDYTEITPMTKLKYLSGFSDKDGNTTPEFYGTINSLEFSESDGITTVVITLKYTSLSVLEMMVERGFKEGFTMTLNTLQGLLAKLSE
ncbi:MAG: SRPBCC domain-containing protein [Saprospiraceae bacterium]